MRFANSPFGRRSFHSALAALFALSCSLPGAAFSEEAAPPADAGESAPADRAERRQERRSKRADRRQNRRAARKQARKERRARRRG
jgi:hypothetical protein